VVFLRSNANRKQGALRSDKETAITPPIRVGSDVTTVGPEVTLIDPLGTFRSLNKSNLASLVKRSLGLGLVQSSCAIFAIDLPLLLLRHVTNALYTEDLGAPSKVTGHSNLLGNTSNLPSQSVETISSYKSSKSSNIVGHNVFSLTSNEEQRSLLEHLLNALKKQKNIIQSKKISNPSGNNEKMILIYSLPDRKSDMYSFISQN